MITARTQQKKSEKSTGNNGRSSLFIAPTQRKKNNQNTTEEKELDLFITPTKQQSLKQDATQGNTDEATVHTPQTTSVTKAKVDSEEKKEEIQSQQSEEGTKEVAEKKVTTNEIVVTESKATKEKTSADTSKTKTKSKATTKSKAKGVGKSYTIPNASQAGVAEKETVKKEEDAPLAIPTENSKVYADGLVSQKPTNFIRGVKESSKTVIEVQNNEQKTLKESLPEIEQPTGIPTKSAIQKQKAKEPSKKAGEQLKSDKSILPDLSPKGKKEGAQISTKSIQPKSSVLARIRSFFGLGKSGSDEDRKSQIKRGIRKLPTSESIATSPGEKPKVDLTGQADPNKNKQNLDDSAATTTKEQQKNLAESKLYKGENDIYPEMELEMLSPTVELTQPPKTTQLADEIPELSAEVKNKFDANAKAKLDADLAPHMEQQNAEYTKMQTDQEKEHKKSEAEIDKETQRVKKEQEAAQNNAKTEVNIQRSEWQKENENVKKEYSEKSEAEKKKIDVQIDDKVKDADSKIEKKYRDTKKEADKEVVKADREAVRRKTQAKKDSEKKSWWDRAVSAVSNFFDKLKEGLNKLFDGLRKLVKGLIEAAKKFANKLIDLARDAIVGMIKAFGEVLKGFVNIALAAFPKLRDKFNVLIDKAVNSAVEAVNTFAEELKKAVNALLDLLGAALDAILAAYQAVFNLLLDVYKMLVVGLLKILKFIANIEEHYNNFIAVIEGLEYLWNNPEVIEEYVIGFLQPYIDLIPEEVQNQITEFFSQAGGAFAKHGQGIWRYLHPILAHLAANWWTEIKKMAWFMIWPFAEGSPVWTETPKLWNLIPQMWQNLKAGEYSKVTDGGLEWFQALNVVAGTFYGWFTIGSILVGAIIGAFFGGAGAIPGAMAGLEFAYAVGEGMLLSMIGGETAIILKAIYDLINTTDDGKDGEAIKKKKEEQQQKAKENGDTKEAKKAPEDVQVRYESDDIETGRDRIEYAYQRIANSGFMLAIMAVFIAFGALGGNIAKALRLKARFRLARMKIKKTKTYQNIKDSKIGRGIERVYELGHKSTDVRKGFDRRKSKADADEAKPIMTEHGEAFGQATTKEGHKVTVTKNGDIYVCASPCDLIELKYKAELERHPEIAKEIDNLRNDPNYLTDQNKADYIAEHIEPRLSKIRQEPWEIFDPKGNQAARDKLREFRGNEDISLSNGFQGGEGILFLSEMNPTKAFKRWYSKRTGDFKKSLQRLQDAYDTVNAIKALSDDIEVVRIYEYGDDWIIRDFDINTRPLVDMDQAAEIAQNIKRKLQAESSAIRERAVKRRKAEVEKRRARGEKSTMGDIYTSTEKMYMEAIKDILSKLKGDKISDNLHWSDSKRKIIIIDMQ